VNRRILVRLGRCGIFGQLEQWRFCSFCFLFSQVPGYEWCYSIAAFLKLLEGGVLCMPIAFFNGIWTYKNLDSKLWLLANELFAWNEFGYWNEVVVELMLGITLAFGNFGVKVKHTKLFRCQLNWSFDDFKLSGLLLLLSLYESWTFVWMIMICEFLSVMTYEFGRVKLARLDSVGRIHSHMWASPLI